MSLPTSTPLLVVATDGSCLGNPGAGGWCWFVDEQCYAAGGDPGPVTNNQMEILALLRLLETLDSSIPAVIEIDSKYVINAVTLWYHNWRKKGWTTSNGTPVANAEALKTVINLLEIRKKNGTTTDLRWVRGHSGSQRNERADTLARTGAEQARAGQRTLRTNVGTLKNLNPDTV